jgi:hypothetical protein
MGQSQQLVRPAARLRARTRVAGIDDAPARRLPIDGTRQGCWADQSN